MTVNVKDASGATVALKSTTETAEEVPHHIVSTANGAGATIGTTADAAASAGGTGSLSAKLRQMSTSVGENADASSATGTLHGKLRNIAVNAGFLPGIDTDVQTVYTYIGNTSDAAVTTNATGTLNGKLRGVVALLAAAIDLANSFINSHLVPHTSGGLSNYHVVSAASDNAANVKASAGQVYGIQVYNKAAYAVYVKLHNTAGTPTAGSGVVRAFGVPAGGGYIWNSDIGVPLGTGIGITIVKDITDAGTTAVALSDCVVDLQYK